MVEVGVVASGELLERGSDLGLAGTRGEVVVGHLEEEEEGGGAGTEWNGDGDEDDEGSRTSQCRALGGKGGMRITVPATTGVLSTTTLYANTQQKIKQANFFYYNI